MKKTLILLTLPFLLAGCSDEKNHPTKETFAKLIKAELERDPKNAELCSTITPPMHEEESRYGLEAEQEGFWQEKVTMAKYGYVTVKKTPASATDPGTLSAKITGKYLQDFGKPTEGGFNQNVKLCYGHEDFKEVTDFLPPQKNDTVGATISQIEYTTTPVVDNSKPWVAHDDLGKAIGFYKMNKEQKHTAIAVLKDSGWVIESLGRD